MKKLSLLSSLLLLLSSCGLFTHGEHLAFDVEPHFYTGDMIYLYGEDTSGFRFDTISEKEFAAFRNRYDRQIDTSSSRIIQGDTFFLVKTHDSLLTLFTGISEDHTAAGYNGFLKPLHLHIITNIDGHNEIGSLLLIDQFTNKKYEINSAIDDPCYLPYVSPKMNYIASFSNNEYEENESFITLIKIDKHQCEYSYTALKTHAFETFRIKELIWIDEHSLSIAIVNTLRNEELEKLIETENYLRVSF